MKYKAVTFVAPMLVCSALATASPSERLLHAALADHFTRHYCESAFPKLRGTIQNAYARSKLRLVDVLCQALVCSNPEHSRGMQTLLARARTLSEGESLQVCSSYAETLKSIEDEFNVELNSISATSSKP